MDESHRSENGGESGNRAGLLPLLDLRKPCLGHELHD